MIEQLFAKACPALFETSALRRHFDPRVAIAADAVVEQLAQVSESAAGTYRHSHSMARPFPLVATEPSAVGAHAATNSGAIASYTSIRLFAYLSALASQAHQ